MALEKENVDFIVAFIRNVDGVLRSSDRYAMDFSEDLKQTILSRVEQSHFLGGMWETKEYSNAPIKAYKLAGWATVSGQGMDKQLHIDGKLIDDEDWYWGESDRERKGIPPPLGGSGFNFGDSTPKPVPIFVPGYEGWRVDYNSLPGEVDLHFHGDMLDNFEVDVHRSKGSNQYGGRYAFTIRSEDAVAEITDYFRKWMAVTEDELENALSKISEDLIRLIFTR